MTTVTLKGNPFAIHGELPQVGTQAPQFTLTAKDLTNLTLDQFKGKKVILNIFPSLDTPTCATSVRKFNKLAAAIKDTVVIAISKDLPFAFGRFCSVEGIENVIAASAFRDQDFGKEYGVLLTEGPLAGLFARAIVVVDENGKVIHSELVAEIANEPNYEKALEIL